MHQPILIPTEDEQTLLNASPRFTELAEDERRFAVAWIQQAAAHRADATANPLSAAAVAKRAGLGRTKAYELAKRPQVLEAIRQGAQAHSDLTDVVGSATLDLVVRRIWEKLSSGLWTVKDIPPHLIKVLQDCKARLGLQPGSAGFSLSLTDAAGNRTELGVNATGEDASSHVAQLMAKLQGSGGGTSAGNGEHDCADSVHTEAIDVECDTAENARTCADKKAAAANQAETDQGASIGGAGESAAPTHEIAAESDAAAGPGCHAQQPSSVTGPAATPDCVDREVRYDG